MINLKILYSRQRRGNDDKSFPIRSKDKSIQQEPTTELLGVTFDQHLTWNEPTNIITKSNYNILEYLRLSNDLHHGMYEKV